MNGIQLPVKITKSKKCKRCTMRYKVIFDKCPHCKDIPDGKMLEEHIQRYHERLQANAKLGFIFLGVMSFLTVVLVLLAI